MKVRVTLTVDVDPKWWNLIYGTDDSESIRDDVRQYVKSHIYESGATEAGAITDVRLQP